MKTINQKICSSKEIDAESDRNSRKGKEQSRTPMIMLVHSSSRATSSFFAN